MKRSLAEARERHLRLARFNFALRRTSAPGAGGRSDTLSLEQLAPWLPSEKPYPRRFFALGTLLFVASEAQARSAFGVADGDRLVGSPDGGAMLLADPRQVRTILANLREVIRLFEMGGDSSVSVQGLAWFNTLVAVEPGRRLGLPFVDLPETYRSHAAVADVVKRTLDAAIGDTQPTVRYEFEGDR
jgi:GAF domain-containing protein